MYKKLLVVLLATLLLPSASATLVRLDFAGTIYNGLTYDEGPSVGEYSGYFIMDSTTPDASENPTNGRYGAGFMGGSVNWNGVVYDLSMSTALIVVRDDTFVFGDLFGVLITGLGTVESPLFSFQLSDSSQSAFNDDSFPGGLSLDGFDALEFDNYNGSGMFATVGSQSFQGTIDSIGYAVVPLPGALVFFASGLFGLASWSRRRSRR